MVRAGSQSTLEILTQGRCGAHALRLLCAIAFASSLLGAPASLLAQDAHRSLVIEVRQLGTGRPHAGALVTVLDSSNARLAQRLTDSSGAASFDLPGSLLVRVRAELVGAESVTSNAVRVGETRTSLQLFLADRRTSLATIAVRGRQRCDRSTSDGARASAVWNEARKALEASVAAERDSTVRPVTVSTVRYVRQLSLRMRVEREELLTGRTHGPTFRSADPAALSRAGWVQDSGNARLFFAPDAPALLSDAFAADHCFRVERRSAGDSVLLGLRFDPAQGRTRSDVSGALWLDAESGELRHVEFRYVNVPDSLNHRMAGGRVEFARLADGRWIVSRWQIRTPRLALVSGARIGALEAPRRMEVVGLQEEGGVAQVATRTTRLLESPTIAGTVYDSSAGGPLAGATVSLEGTGFQDTTDSRGRFLLRPTLPGGYRLLVRHARLERLGLGILTDSIDAGAGAAIDRTLAVPSIGTLARQRCPAGSLAPDRPLWMVGLLADSATALPLPGASVSAGWFDSRVAQRGSMVVARGDSAFVESETDAGGRFVLCGLPREHALRLTASGRGRTARLLVPPTLEAPGMTVRETLLELLLAATPHRVSSAAAATTLAGVRVEGRAPERGKLAPFDRRRSSAAGGRFIDRDLLATQEASRLSDVLRSQLPGVQLQRLSRVGLVLISSRTAGSADPRRRRSCYVQLFLDGVKLFGQSMAVAGATPPGIDAFQVVELDGIEFYPGSATTPPEFGGRDAECGTLVMWTRER